MSPNIDKYSAGISVNCPEQSPQRIVKTDDKNSRADRLQVLRHKTHPKLFAGTNDENGDKQNDEIALEPEEISNPTTKAYDLSTWRLHSA